MSDERPGRPSGRTLALRTLVGAMVSIQFGASLARGLFPAIGPEGTTALQLLLAAAVLWVVWRPWRTRLAVGAARALGLYGAPSGGMFAMPIEIEPNTPGAELLHSATADSLIAIEGSLQLRRTFDGRYATDAKDARGRTDRGRSTRELQVLVSCVREPNEHERRASSAVWLEGEVAEPPRISRHPDLPSIQLAGSILRVLFGRPADFPVRAAALRCLYLRLSTMVVQLMRLTRLRCKPA